MLQPLVNCCCCSVYPSSSSFLLTCIKTTTRKELARLGMGTIFSSLLSVERSETPPPNHLGLDFHIIGIYTYVVRTFLIRVRVLVICDRNSIATKREEFPARLVEVASSRLYFASRASLLQLLQQTYSALCQQPVWKSV